MSYAVTIVQTIFKLCDLRWNEICIWLWFDIVCSYNKTENLSVDECLINAWQLPKDATATWYWFIKLKIR